MDIAATRQQDHQLGLYTNEKRVKSYTVGIPKIISFDINVTKNARKSEKRVHNTPIQYDDPSLVISPPIYRKEPFSSRSDDLMHSPNNATTYSDSIEMVDQEERLKDLPTMLEKLASSNLIDTETKTVKPTGFVRTSDITPHRRESNRRTTGRMTPTLGSNRITTRTAPTSPTVSPLSSPRSSIVMTPDEIPLMDEKMMTTPVPSVLPPKRAISSMKPPRQSLYDSNVVRRPRITEPVQYINDDLTHSTSSSSVVVNSSIREEEDMQQEKKPVPLKRSITQYNRDIDGFIQELSTMDEEEEEEEEMVLNKVTLYSVSKQGDLMPPDQINHEAVNLYEGGVVNWRIRQYEFDVPETNFCFHCDRELQNTHFSRTVGLTEHRHDILYGVLRCRIYRDINLCSACYHTSDLTGVIRITVRAKKMFVPIYHQDASSS